MKFQFFVIFKNIYILRSSDQKYYLKKHVMNAISEDHQQDWKNNVEIALLCKLLPSQRI